MFNQIVVGVCFDERCTVIRFFHNISRNEVALKSRVCVEVLVSVVHFQGAILRHLMLILFPWLIPVSEESNIKTFIYPASAERISSSSRL